MSELRMRASSTSATSHSSGDTPCPSRNRLIRCSRVISAASVYGGAAVSSAGWTWSSVSCALTRDPARKTGAASKAPASARRIIPKSLLSRPGCHNAPGLVGTADLHIHTAWSDGMMTVPELLAYVTERTALDVIAVTDHDQIRGALDAAERCAGTPGGRIQAVVGTEISSSWGRHVVALFFREPYPTSPFPRFRGLRETAARVHDAGGVLVLPHALSVLVP